MAKFWDSFQVYNKNKHEKHPEMMGGNHANAGGDTQYMYSTEHYETKPMAVPATVGSSKVMVEPTRRRSSAVSGMSMGSSNASHNEAPAQMSPTGDEYGKGGFSGDKTFNTAAAIDALDPTTKREISHMSQGEFQRIYNSLKKGEPNNNVNF